jgi:hypothetical protein
MTQIFLKMEAELFSETSVSVHRIIRLHIPEDSTFHIRRFENVEYK